MRAKDYVVSIDEYAEDVLSRIKTNFDVDSEFNPGDSTLRLYVKNVNNAVRLPKAKEYIENYFPFNVKIEL